MAVAYMCIAYGNSYEMVMLAMLLAGLGMGVMIPNANIWVMQLAPPEIRGKEIGRLTTFWFMGQFLSPIVLLPFLEFTTQARLFFILAMVLLGLSVLLLVFYLWSQKTKSYT